MQNVNFNSSNLQHGINTHDHHHKPSLTNHHNHLLICTNNPSSNGIPSSSNPTPAVRIITSNVQNTPIGYITSPNVVLDYNNSNTILSSGPNTSQLTFLASSNNEHHYSLVHVLPQSPSFSTPNENTNVNNLQTHGNLNVNLNTNQFNSNYINLHHHHHHHHSHHHQMQHQYLDGNNNNNSNEGNFFLFKVYQIHLILFIVFFFR